VNDLTSFAATRCKFVTFCDLRVLCMLCSSLSIDIYYNLSAFRMHC